ncbi:MAG: hypothetical protein GXP49_13205 [Deltaproteobacteria bacterium]|nr:hypothetical protein [Deltaproteobacteria bacterium]
MAHTNLGPVFIRSRRGRGANLGGRCTVSAGRDLYTISTGKTRWLTLDPSNQDQAWVYGDVVAWTDLRNGYEDSYGRRYDSDIYLYDIKTNRVIQVTDMEGVDYAPRLYGTTLVWYHNANGAMYWYDDCYMMDISRLIGRSENPG